MWTITPWCTDIIIINYLLISRLIPKDLLHASCYICHINLINVNSHVSKHKRFMAIAFVLPRPRLSLLLAPFPKHLSWDPAWAMALVSRTSCAVSWVQRAGEGHSAAGSLSTPLPASAYQILPSGQNPPGHTLHSGRDTKPFIKYT